MFLKSLNLQNFRNYTSLQLELRPGLNLFLGKNGQGKTNLIEAIQLLTCGKSFRPGRPGDFIQSTQDSAVVDGVVETSVGNWELKLILQGQSKKWRLNDKPISGNGMAKEFPSVLFSPESLAVIKSGPDTRRDFLDETLASFSASHFRALEDYARALRSRNRILRDAQREQIPLRQANDLLDSIENPFLTAATSLVEARLNTLNALADDFNVTAHRVDPTLNVDVNVEYVVSDRVANSWTRDEIIIALRQRVHELRQQELAVGHSLVGPHKHDVRILYGRQDSRIWCSQGQQRALILSFKLARIVYHYKVHKSYPFLLLDDVLSELDSEKRENLVSALSRMQGQIFVTSTENTTSLSTLEQTVYQVCAGKIELS